MFLINDSNKNSMFIHTEGDHGGGIILRDDKFNELVTIGVDENGGYVITWNKDLHRTGELHKH